MAVLNKKEKGAKKIKIKNTLTGEIPSLKERVSQCRHDAGGYTACQLACLVLY